MIVVNVANEVFCGSFNVFVVDVAMLLWILQCCGCGCCNVVDVAMLRMLQCCCGCCNVVVDVAMLLF